MCLSYKDVSLSRKFPEGSNTWAHDLHLTPECFKSKSRVIAVKLPRSVLLFIWGLLGIKEGSIWAAAWKFLVDFEPLFPRTFVARHTSGTDPSQSIFRVSSFKSSTISSLLFMQPSPPPPPISVSTVHTHALVCDIFPMTSSWRNFICPFCNLLITSLAKETVWVQFLSPPFRISFTAGYQVSASSTPLKFLPQNHQSLIDRQV